MDPEDQCFLYPHVGQKVLLVLQALVVLVNLYPHLVQTLLLHLVDLAAQWGQMVQQVLSCQYHLLGLGLQLDLEDLVVQVDQ